MFGSKSFLKILIKFLCHESTKEKDKKKNLNKSLKQEGTKIFFDQRSFEKKIRINFVNQENTEKKMKKNFLDRNSF